MCVAEHEGEKAAGTPMMRPLPVRSSRASETRLPGENSASSMSGIASPTETDWREEAWNRRRLVDAGAMRRRATAAMVGVRMAVVLRWAMMMNNEGKAKRSGTVSKAVGRGKMGEDDLVVIFVVHRRARSGSA